MHFICGLLFLWLFTHPSLAAHPPSPCPDIFAYEGLEPENNRWYGEISLSTDESLVGIRLDVELDRPSELMVSWMGEITTNDNIKFTVLNLNQRLRPGPPVLSRIMVKFNRSTGSPKVRFIRLNGRKICPEDTSYTSEFGESVRPQRPQSTKRPDPEFGESYGGNVDEDPLNTIVNGNTNNNNNRPNVQPNDNNYNNNRPNVQPNDNNYNNNRPNVQPNDNSYNNNRPNVQPNDNNYNNNSPNTDYSSPNINNNRPVYKPASITTTTEEPYTTRKSIKTTTARNIYDGNGNKPNSINPNTVSLQASSTDSSSQINGVINGLLQNNQNSNKTVIITVIDNNQQNSQEQQNRPNNNGRPSDNNSGQSRPNSNRPSELQPTSSNQRPNNNNNQGSNSIASTSNSQQHSSGACGEVKLAVPLVTAGQSTHRGQWPWHVALYMIEGINLSYHCGGSLVSKNKVITAAHCVTSKQSDVVVNSSKIVVYLGKYHQLQYSDELGVQTKQVIRINVYPSYNSSNFLGDIAILTLSSDAEFTNYVTPVCLWDDKSNNLDDIVNKDGTVVGWGFDENDTPTEELKMAKMPVVSHQTCLWSYPQFYSEFTSDKTFCAGFRNGTSVCNGDSGGGMVFNKNSRWYLRGIVSITVAKEGLRVCDTKHYVVFTDVAKYNDFVKKNLR